MDVICCLSSGCNNLSNKKAQKAVPAARVVVQSGFINSFPFDPVGMNSPKHAINEVKNGRLAMVSAHHQGFTFLHNDCPAQLL